MAEDEIQNAAGQTTGFLKKKAGPLEVWQWAVGVVGLVAAYLAYKSFKGGGASGQPATVGGTISSVPPGDLGTTQPQTALSGQLQNIEGQLGQIASQTSPAAIQANSNPSGTSSSTLGGLANWQAFTQSPAALSLADTNSQAYVTAQYESILGRAPDTSGLQYWEGQLGSAPTQAQVTAENQAFLGATANEIAQREQTITPTP